ncbi:hypothetical protein CCYA_CCYA01G0025 [Cyanidiococcus yangmingshanensis]|nr:hypothetical protein CCYA_CCYA01G0025 [Cyanidiococcus yangmingshanensis]
MAACGLLPRSDSFGANEAPEPPRGRRPRRYYTRRLDWRSGPVRARWLRQLLTLLSFLLLVWAYWKASFYDLKQERVSKERVTSVMAGLWKKAVPSGLARKPSKPSWTWPPLTRPDLVMGNERFLDQSARNERRREAVRQAMQHAWQAYRRDAWGHDELRPLSHSFEDSMNGVGLTMIDSLDTLYLMGLMDEFREARDWLASSQHRFAQPQARAVSTFEMNIRLLGGLLSAHQLSGDAIFLHKAEELGHLLAHAFLGRPPPRMPHPACRFMARNENATSGEGDTTVVVCRASDRAVLSECGTLQLEFRALAAATHDPLLKGVALRADQVLRDILTRAPANALPNILLQSSDGRSLVDNSSDFIRHVNLGAAGDSYYEYIVKSYIQLGRSDPFWRHESERVIDALERIVFRRGVLLDTTEPLVDVESEGSSAGVHFQSLKRFVNVSWPVILSNTDVLHQPDHLSCFAASLFVLEVPPSEWSASPTSARARHLLRLADEHARFCYEMYLVNAGLSGESVVVQKMTPNDSPYPDRPQVSIQSYITRYHQRPETLEALFYLWRATHNPKYREWGWTIFQAMEWYTRVPSGGYIGCNDPHLGCKDPIDKMESFFLAETLKYAYLLFSDDSILDIKTDWVLNTEAHPLRISKNSGQDLTSAVHS